MTREDRAQELRRLVDGNPQRLIAIYRDATGMDELHPLSPGVDFQAMIATILQFEASAGQFQSGSPHGAGMV